MSDRHVFKDHTSLVLRSLRGLVASQPSLSLIPSIKTVIDATHHKDKVTLICGGGAGHEPGSTGFVGRGLLTASVSGDTFASPSAKQVYGAIKACPSDRGTVLIITNYTGDNLHFGLAAQQARADGLPNVGILPVGDDVSVGRTKGKLVGRRALAGTILVCKILGAAAEEGYGFHQILGLGKAVTDSLSSIAATLDHAHVPGRSGEHGRIPDDTVEIGLGLHNEPGFFVVKPQPSSEELIARMLNLLLDQNDPERSYVSYNPSDTIVLFVNNMGGLSTLEMGAIVDEALTHLEKSSGIVPVRIYNGTFMTTLNAIGFSLSLLNVSQVAHEAGVYVHTVLALLDAPHASANWPSKSVYPTPEHLEKRKREEKYVEVPKEEKVREGAGTAQLFVSASAMEKVIRSAATSVLNSEPDLTRWDTIVGDGDCGETCAAGAKAVLDALDKGLGKDGEVISVLRYLTELIDDTCGGTLGAIYSIFLAALTSEVRLLTLSHSSSHSPSTPATGTAKVNVTPAFWGEAAHSALETLKLSTAARVGHRTVMDALIPFVEALKSAGANSNTNSGANSDPNPDPSSSSSANANEAYEKAVKAAREGGEGTKRLKAKLGRATYVNEGEGGLPPDPGAMSFVALVEGLLEGLGGGV